MFQYTLPDFPERGAIWDWTFVLVAMVLPTLVTWVYFIVLRGTAAQLSYAVGKVIQFSLPLVWWCLINQQSLSLDGLAASWPGIFWGIGFGIVVAVAMVVLYRQLQTWPPMLAALDKIRLKIKELRVHSPAKMVALGVFYSLIHSFAEEYYWRWFVFRELTRLMSDGGAMVISSLGFMGHHVILLATYFGWRSAFGYFCSLSVAIGGLFWAYLYWQSGSLVGPWISHLLVDAAIFYLGYQIAFPPKKSRPASA